MNGLKLKNKPKLLLIGMLALLLFACGDRPSYVLSDKKMEDVMFDLYIAEAARTDNYRIFDNDSLRKQELLNSVFDKHKITEQAFDTTLVWYVSNMEQYMKVLDRVIARYEITAENLRDSIDKKKKELADSPDMALIAANYFILEAPQKLQSHRTFAKADSLLAQVVEYRISFNMLGAVEGVSPELNFHVHTSDSLFKFHRSIKNPGRFLETFVIPGSYSPDSIFASVEIPDSLVARFSFVDFSVSKVPKKSPFEVGFFND